MCAELLDGSAEEIMAKLVEQAQAGEPVALRLAVERLVPVRATRDRAVVFDAPRIERAQDLVSAAAEVVARVACGELTLSEGKEFMALIEQQRKLIELSDVVIRLEAVEQRLGQPAGRESAGDPDVAARVRRIIADHVGDDGRRR